MIHSKEHLAKFENLCKNIVNCKKVGLFVLYEKYKELAKLFRAMDINTIQDLQTLLYSINKSQYVNSSLIIKTVLSREGTPQDIAAAFNFIMLMLVAYEKEKAFTNFKILLNTWITFLQKYQYIDDVIKNSCAHFYNTKVEKFVYNSILQNPYLSDKNKAAQIFKV